MKSNSLLIAAVTVALATSAQAQVKVGSNPGSISANAVLDVEGTSGSRTVVLQNGNMGVGIAAPTNNLHVSGANAYGLLKLQSSNGTSEVQFLNNTGNPWYVGKNAGSGGSDNMSFSYNALAPVATMTSSGSMGVGTAAPVSRFSVVNNGGGGGTADDMELSSYGSSTGPAFIFKSGTGTAAAPGNLATNSFLGGVFFGGQIAGSAQVGSSIQSGYSGNGTTNLSNLTFGTSNAERMRVSEVGNLGIGTINPARKVHVYDNSATNDVSLYIESPGSDMNGMIYLNASSRPTSSNIDQFMFFQQSSSIVGSIVSNGSAGVTYQTTSDKRLKENIVTTHFGIKDLMKIGVKDYTMKGIPGKVRTGFLAQDLNTIYPEAVSVGGEDASKKPWTVDYGRITPLLVKSIQDQQVQIEALKKKNQALEAQVSDVASLRSELEAIKALVLKNSPAQKATSVTKR